MAKYLDLDGLTRYNNKVNAKLDTKADVDGNYEDMAVGQLLSNTFEEDKTPYNFRTSGGTLEIGDREYDTLVGGTVAFNQLVKNENFANTSEWITNDATISASENVLSFTGSSSSAMVYQPLSLVGGHKYLKIGTFKLSGTPNKNVWFRVNKGDGTYDDTYLDKTNTNWQTISSILECAVSDTLSIALRDNSTSDWVTILCKNFMAIDLTQMFGSTIADYIYSLEQATAGSGVAYFRSLFPYNHYAYNTGQLRSVKALSHKMVGFNQFDKSTATDGKKRSASTGAIQSNVLWYMSDYIRVFPNTVYYTNADGTGNDYPITLYDSEKNYIGFITGNAGPRTFNTGNATYIVLSSMTAKTNVDDLVLNLHWDGERDGEYEAYSEHIYPLDSDLELRGIPKLDANNQLYYDGDTYESDGTVTRKYGIVDLGSLTWGKNTYSNYSYFAAKIVSCIDSPAVSSNHIPVCAIYTGLKPYYVSGLLDKTIMYRIDKNGVFVRDDSKSEMTPEEFKTAMSGIMLQFEKATPTTETADTFENPQLVDNWGTEEYTDSREVQIPVGHITKYPPDLKAKLESAPDSPASDGDYILRHNNGENSYVALTKELPAVPTTDGTYVLKATVSSGVATLSWVAEE